MKINTKKCLFSQTKTQFRGEIDEPSFLEIQPNQHVFEIYKYTHEEDPMSHKSLTKFEHKIWKKNKMFYDILGNVLNDQLSQTS